MENIGTSEADIDDAMPPFDDKGYEKARADAVEIAKTVTMTTKTTLDGVTEEQAYSNNSPQVEVTEVVYPTHTSTRVEIGVVFPLSLPRGKVAEVSARVSVEMTGTKRNVNKYIFRQADRDLRVALSCAKEVVASESQRSG